MMMIWTSAKKKTEEDDNGVLYREQNMKNVYYWDL
jgi:hypothetical protein